MITHFIVALDPSNYTSGVVFDSYQKALNHRLAIESVVGKKHYIIELHYDNGDKETPPSKIFAYDGEKRIKII